MEKARHRFPDAGFNSCDDVDMRVICPTCQILFRALIPDRIKRRSDRQPTGRLRHPCDLDGDARQAVAEIMPVGVR